MYCYIAWDLDIIHFKTYYYNRNYRIAIISLSIALSLLIFIIIITFLKTCFYYGSSSSAKPFEIIHVYKTCKRI